VPDAGGPREGIGYLKKKACEKGSGKSKHNNKRRKGVKSLRRKREGSPEKERLSFPLLVIIIRRKVWKLLKGMKALLTIPNA